MNAALATILPSLSRIAIHRVCRMSLSPMAELVTDPARATTIHRALIIVQPEGRHVIDLYADLTAALEPQGPDAAPAPVPTIADALYTLGLRARNDCRPDLAAAIDFLAAAARA